MKKTWDSLEEKGYNYDENFEDLKKQNGGEPIVAPRMFVGKNFNGDAGMFIQDKYGVERLRVYVDSSNTPKIEVRDENGKIVRDLLDK